jgi:RNA polymerase sigma-70 factor (ECF subfamily)
MLQEQLDEVLLKLYIEGDMEAFSTLYNRHKAGTFRYLLRQIRDTGLAEDLHQDVWSQVISHGASFQAKAKFSTWLYTIARNKIIDHIRHAQIQNKVITHNVDAQTSGERHIQEEDPNAPLEGEKQLHESRQSAALQVCLQKLPLQLLDVFLLKQEAGMTAQQIAEIVQATHEATKSRMRNAYKQLAKCLQYKFDLGKEQV